MVPEGTIKLAVTLGEYPRVAKIVIEFLAVNYPLAFNRVLGRLLLQAAKAVTFIHCLTRKFPTTTGISQSRKIVGL